MRLFMFWTNPVDLGSKGFIYLTTIPPCDYNLIDWWTEVKNIIQHPKIAAVGQEICSDLNGLTGMLHEVVCLAGWKFGAQGVIGVPLGLPYLPISFRHQAYSILGKRIEVNFWKDAPYIPEQSWFCSHHFHLAFPRAKSLDLVTRYRLSHKQVGLVVESSFLLPRHQGGHCIPVLLL